MADKPKTASQLRKEIEANKKANEKLQKELNGLAQRAINKEIEAVEDSLRTLIADKDFDMTDLKKKFKSLLEKSYGKEYTVKISKKSSAIDFAWDTLKEKMNEEGFTSEDNTAGSGALAELYSGKSNVKFSQRWNKKDERPDWLVQIGKAASASYYAKP
jgi:hypothetical protein